MKKIIFILIATIAFTSCKDDCKTCPQNFVLKNNECKCESGVVINGECESIEGVRESNGYIQEKTPICEGFEGVELYQIAFQYYDSDPNSPKMNLHFFGEEVISEHGITYAVGADSFQFAPYKFHAMNGITFTNNGGQYFEKQIDGETCYLRCNIKVLSERHMKYYFYFANLKDERKSEYCVRHFYQP